MRFDDDNVIIKIKILKKFLSSCTHRDVYTSL